MNWKVDSGLSVESSQYISNYSKSNWDNEQKRTDSVSYIVNINTGKLKQKSPIFNDSRENYGSASNLKGNHRYRIQF